MTEPDTAAIAASLAGWSLAFVPPGSAEASRVPDQWQPIVSSVDAAERARTALALWNLEFLDLIPRFAAALATRLADVRVCLVGNSPALVYTMTSMKGDLVSWVGYDPRTFAEPPFWDSFPPALRTFLTEVHAGFVSADGASFGPDRPRDMETIAERADFPDGVPGWDEDADIASTRLVIISSDGGILFYCLSPDLGPSRVALVYEGDIDPQDFGVQFDELMMAGLDGW